MHPRAKPCVLAPFDMRESISFKEAEEISGTTPNTIRAWAEQHGIGRKIGGA